MLLCGDEVRVKGVDEVEEAEKVEELERERRDVGVSAVRRVRRGVKDWKRLGRVECIFAVVCL